MTNDSLTPEQVAVLDELPHREPYLSFRRIVISQARRVVELESALLPLKLAVVGHENTRHVHEPRAATETTNNLVAELLDLIEGRCPKCKWDDLHSAALDGKAAISCCRCDYMVTYESLKQRAVVPPNGGLIYEDSLPKMSDSEYAIWFARSQIIDGVRMGPPFERIVGYSVHSKGIGTGAMYNAEQEKEAREAAARWGCAITALVAHPQAPVEPVAPPSDDYAFAGPPPIDVNEVLGMLADEDLKRCLKFYADGLHFDPGNALDWDSVSGEPENFLCDEHGNTVEDGTLARLVLEGKKINWDEDEQQELPIEPGAGQ